MKHIISILAAGTVLLGAAPAALAEHDASEASDFTPAFAASRAGAFVDLWPTRNNVSTVFGAELQLGVSKHLFIDLSYAGSFAHIGDAVDSSDNLGFGNPSLGLHVAAAPTRNFHYFAGIGLTAPLLADPSEQVSNAAFYGQRVRGYYDADRFVRSHMAARGAVGMEWQAARPLFVRGEVRPVVYIPINDKHPVISKDRLDLPTEQGGDAELMVEHALELEARTDGGLGVGARIQGVIMPMGDDLLQTTIEPFLNLTPKREGVYARLGFPLALDEDLGFGFEEDKLAGVRLQIGGQW